MPRTIVLKGEPKSTQHIYKFSTRPFPKMYMTAEGAAIKEDYGWQAKSQWQAEPLKDDVAIDAIFYYGTRRKFDLDNANKLWADALAGIVYEDDNQIASLFLKRRYDKENPRIEITISKAN
jgi:Holliday junction resolvase RusA-like endonuclease